MLINKPDLPYVIFLTGGIGSGKSTVAEYFARLDVPIIDTDEIARNLVIPGSQALQLIVSHFGEKILAEDGSLNRRKLRQIVFSTPVEKSWLESLLHPKIQQEVTSRLSNLHSDIAIVVVPLLFEKPDYPYLGNRVLVVDAKEETQIERASLRDQVDAEDIQKIIMSQISRDERLKNADDVVNNECSKEELMKKVKELYDFYKQEARKREMH